MTRDEASELGSRALVAGWSWDFYEGCLDMDGRRADHADDAPPDFRDPATLGCLDDLVRSRSRDEGTYVRLLGKKDQKERHWHVYRVSGLKGFGAGKTRAEALVACLEHYGV